MIRAIASAFPVASNATRSSAARLCANNPSAAGVVSTRRARRTRPASAIATSQKSRCTSKPMNRIPTSSQSLKDGDEAGETTTTDPCARHTRAVAGAANYKQRARSP